MEELNRTQWLSRDELLALQRDKLLRLVEYADQFVPYYRRVFKEVGFQPDDLRQDMANLSKIPILTKSIIRRNWNDLLTTEPERRRQMSQLATSGSTGEPLVFMQDNDFRDFRHRRYPASYELGRLETGGFAGMDLGSAKLNPTLRAAPALHRIDRVWNRFQMDAFAWISQ